MELEEVVVIRSQSERQCTSTSARQIPSRQVSTTAKFLGLDTHQSWKTAAAVSGSVGGDDVEFVGKLNRANKKDASEQCKDNKRWALRLDQNSIPVSLLAETSIHGLKYIAQENRHWFERLFWLSSFLLGVISSGYLIHGVWDRYNATPVIVTFDANGQRTSSIPFPAVTICNDNLVSRRRVDSLKRILAETPVTDSEHREATKKLDAASTLCNQQISLASKFSMVFRKSPDDHDSENTDDVFKFLVEDTPPCSEMIRGCRLGDFQYPCWALFEPMYTTYGKCCTFNILPPQLLFKNLTKHAKKGWADVELENWKRWIIEKPESLDPSDHPRPWRQVGTGQQYGLSILIAPEPDDKYCGGSHSEGPHVLLHSWLEMPRMSEFSAVAHHGKEIWVEVNADITKADDDIRDFPPEKRKCVFPNERQLQSFTYYTRENCLEECTASYLKKECGCVPFPLSHYDVARGGKMCTYEDRHCTHPANLNLQFHLNKICAACDPLCEETKYGQQSTMANLKSTSELLGDMPPDERPKWSNGTMTLIHVFFASERIIPKLRKALYGMEDLIANTGGILGLCLGFSVLSGIELVYFVTLRTICKHGRQRGMACPRFSMRGKLKGMFKLRSQVVPVGDD